MAPGKHAVRNDKLEHFYYSRSYGQNTKTFNYNNA